jgi:hypothetical protein
MRDWIALEAAAAMSGLNAECAELHAENEALRKDAARYRWLREHNPVLLCGIAWGVRVACSFSEPDAAIDAAMSHA